MLKEKLTMKKKWTIRRYNSHQDFLDGKLPKDIIDALGNILPGESIFEENILLNEGIAILQSLLIGGAGTDYGNANAFLGVGDGSSSSLTGTSVTFTNASDQVTGIGTSFTTELAVGSIVQLDADAAWAEVLSIESNTAFTLTANYTGTGGTGNGSYMTASAADTGLTGTATYKAMEATYPQIASQTTTWRSVFGTTDANLEWLEFTVGNANSNAGDNLNRRLSVQGTKAAGQTWTLDLAITFS